MPKIPRLKLKGEPVVYHTMTGTALDAFMLGDMEGEDDLNITSRKNSKKSIIRSNHCCPDNFFMFYK